MTTITTPSSLALVPSLETAWQDVDSSFERFCLAAGIGAIEQMLCEDARQLAGVPHHRGGGRRVLINRDCFGNRWLPQKTCALRQKFRRSSSAVATSREGRRSPRSGRAVQRRRWGRGSHLQKIRLNWRGGKAALAAAWSDHWSDFNPVACVLTASHDSQSELIAMAGDSRALLRSLEVPGCEPASIGRTRRS
jgi:hypothetical protein